MLAAAHLRRTSKLDPEPLGPFSPGPLGLDEWPSKDGRGGPPRKGTWRWTWPEVGLGHQFARPSAAIGRGWSSHSTSRRRISTRWKLRRLRAAPCARDCELTAKRVSASAMRRRLSLRSIPAVGSWAITDAAPVARTAQSAAASSACGHEKRTGHRCRVLDFIRAAGGRCRVRTDDGARRTRLGWLASGSGGRRLRRPTFLPCSALPGR
jgi:hypothetical protein